jgi:hypothetical protein
MGAGQHGSGHGFRAWKHGMGSELGSIHGLRAWFEGIGSGQV